MRRWPMSSAIAKAMMCGVGMLAMVGATAGGTGPPAAAPIVVAQASEPNQKGQDAKAAITLPDGQPVPATWPAGFSIRLSSHTSVAGTRPGKSVKWYVDPAWIDRQSERDMPPGTISVGTGTRPKTIKVTLKVAKADTFDEQTIAVQIVPNPDEPEQVPIPPTPTPTPVPIPIPPTPIPPTPIPPTPVPPTPTPTPVDPLRPYAKEVADAVRTYVADYPDRVAVAGKLGDAYADTIGKISQAAARNPVPADLAAYTDPDSLITATSKLVVAALGADIDRWRPFFKWSEDDLNRKDDAGQLSTAASYVPVYGDIAAGLRSIR
jgi:hypothetical protein